MNSICILIPTHNHPFHIKEWLDTMIGVTKENDIDVHIFDSSVDDNTKEICEDEIYSKVKYHRYVSNDITPDKKVYDAFLELKDKYEYILLCGDGCIVDLNKMLTFSNNEINNHYDILHFCIPELNINKIPFSEPKLFCKGGPDYAKKFVHSHTLYGATIYSSNVINKMIDKIDCSKYFLTGFFPQFAILSVLELDSKISVYEGDFYWSSHEKIKSGSGSYNGDRLFELWVKQWCNVTKMLPSIYDKVRKNIYQAESKGCLSKKAIIFAKIKGCVSIKYVKKYWKYFPYILTYSRLYLILISLTPKWMLFMMKKIYHFLKGDVKK